MQLARKHRRESVIDRGDGAMFAGVAKRAVPRGDNLLSRAHSRGNLTPRAQEVPSQEIHPALLDLRMSASAAGVGVGSEQQEVSFKTDIVENTSRTSAYVDRPQETVQSLGCAQSLRLSSIPLRTTDRKEASDVTSTQKMVGSDFISPSPRSVGSLASIQIFDEGEGSLNRTDGSPPLPPLSGKQMVNGIGNGRTYSQDQRQAAPSAAGNGAAVDLEELNRDVKRILSLLEGLAAKSSHSNN